MSDAEFVAAFESCSFPPDAFHHREHVRLAWIYLSGRPLLEALTRFAASLRRFATNAGAATKYHETVTFAFLFLIHERMQREVSATFDDFAAANEDLFGWPSVLDRYYSAETLRSELARRTFILPDASATIAGS